MTDSIDNYAVVFTVHNAREFSRRVMEKMKQSDVIGPDLAYKIHWDLKGILLNVDPVVRAEVERIRHEVFEELATCNSP